MCACADRHHSQGPRHPRGVFSHLLMLVSVILPAYNEKQNLQELVPAIFAALADSPVEVEVLVVDDNSPDGTIPAMEALRDQSHPGLVPVLRTENRGFANSIRAGLERARGEVLLVMDSDGNHDPRYLPFMVDAVRHYPCVSGSRFVYGGAMRSRSRHLLSWLFNIYTRVLTGGLVTDSLYGYFAIRREVLQAIDYDQVFYGYGDYCIRLFALLQRQEVEILQFPAVNAPRRHGDSQSSFFRVFRLYFLEVIKLAYRVRIRRDV